MRQRTREKDRTQEVEHFQNYSEYSKTLRSWLVAYGIGGPVLFLTNEKLAEKLSAAPEKQMIVSLFLIGVALQILLSLINKWCAWYMYAGENDLRIRLRRSYRIWNTINHQSWLDFWVDALSIIAFFTSTVLVLRVFL